MLPTYHDLVSPIYINQGFVQKNVNVGRWYQNLDMYHLLMRDLEAEVKRMDSFWEYSAYKGNGKQSYNFYFKF